MNSSSDGCRLTRFNVWPDSCPPSFIETYKAVSIMLAIAYTIPVLLHVRNLGVRIVKHKFNIKTSNTPMMIDITSTLVAAFSLLYYTNMGGYHHKDGCMAEIAGDLRISLCILLG